MFGKGKSQKAPMPFVVSYRIDDDVTSHLMSLVVSSGFKPEQIARYALKRYLTEVSRSSEV